MPIDRSAGFEKRAVEGFLGVALQRLGELSGSWAEAALDRFEPSLVQALRAFTGPEAAMPSTRTAVEDTIVILRRTIDRASRTILRRARVDASPVRHGFHEASRFVCLARSTTEARLRCEAGKHR